MIFLFLRWERNGSIGRNRVDRNTIEWHDMTWHDMTWHDMTRLNDMTDFFGNLCSTCHNGSIVRKRFLCSKKFFLFEKGFFVRKTFSTQERQSRFDEWCFDELSFKKLIYFVQSCFGIVFWLLKKKFRSIDSFLSTVFRMRCPSF